MTDLPRTGLLVIAAIAASATAVARPAGDQARVAVTVYVSVLDRGNRPVAGLTTADFSIAEDGTGRPVISAAPATGPLAIGLIVDTAQLAMGASAPTRDLRVALTAFTKTVIGSHAETQVALMESGGAALLRVPFTHQLDTIAIGVSHLMQTQRTSAVVLEALQDLSTTMAAQSAGRRAIVSIDFNSPETSQIHEPAYAAALQRSGASVWAVSVRGTGESPMARDAILDWTTRVTGGLRIIIATPSALESQLRVIAAALTSQYVVQYERAGTEQVREVRASATRGAKFLTTRAVAR